MEPSEKKQEKSAAAEREEKILEFWNEQQIFKKSLEKEAPKGEFVFYEGPPTANGKPGIHHLEARAFKDIIPRYKTMRGFHVRRKGGWDTHGLPVELQVEKKLGLSSKKEIENYGIAQFNKECKESVWEFLDIWNKFTHRIGYWVDQENPYVTYESKYIESVWNVLKNVSDKNFLYKDYKVVPWCPRCGTALSSHELAQGYEDVKDLSVYVKFKISGKENEYILAWTTTPWTLPGNVGLAVGEKIDYVKIKIGDGFIYLAGSRLSVITEAYEIIEKIKGTNLVGLEYEPLYPFLQDDVSGAEREKLPNAFKVYPADFVTTTDGTGIVHTAVMYGQEDFELGTKVGLPKYHLVNDDGTFKPETGFLAGKFVKDEATAVEIIKDLAHRGLLFKKEKYEHSYPHCWRCKTPLIYFARDSWYIRMSSLSDEMVKENQSINWEPAHIRDGRFGEWLKDIKDWAISRERYWGTPLPIWTTESGKTEVIGSLEDLKKKTKKSGNTYFVMRHGEAVNNVTEECVVDSAPCPLTENGQKQVLEKTKEFNQKVDIIISSPYVRTKETTAILCQQLNFPLDQVVYDDRIHEWQISSEFIGKDRSAMKQYYDHDYVFEPEKRFSDGESFADVVNRAGDFIYDIDAKYDGKNILIISHSGTERALNFIAEGVTFADMATRNDLNNPPNNAEIRLLPFVPIPHNEKYELDLHRPYIDEIELVSDDGEPMKRVKEVMDVWFDSGAMPFAQDHYPFENKEWVDTKGYPADYISEAIDQTRGWFYTLHAVGILMGRGKAYKNVICLGHILDEKGKKMSKSQGNIVDPWTMIDKYGVDTLRLWMYAVNQPGDSKNFDEKTVAELHNKVFNLLYNVLAFYELYRDKNLETQPTDFMPKNVLDQWILAELNVLNKKITDHLDGFKILEPVRLIRSFIDDLSTWYVRRSRDRIKEVDAESKQTLYIVLINLAKFMAPFAPFASEDIWQKLKNEGDKESVHLENWPESRTTDEELIKNIETVRTICTGGNALRKKLGIPVRQPLNELRIKNYELGIEYSEIIKDELNIKNVVQNSAVAEDFEFDTTITPELKAEGNYRELVRGLQDLRKQQGLTPSDVISLSIQTDSIGKSLIEKFESDLKKTVLVKDVSFTENDGTEIKIEDMVFKVTIEK
ncbi:MAG: class I tRNA ligase family protein [Candidatus Paceibacterota bacterium]|jgi:isoleucyl-tRNA synthetase